MQGNFCGLGDFYFSLSIFLIAFAAIPSTLFSDRQNVLQWEWEVLSSVIGELIPQFQTPRLPKRCSHLHR